ncbi:MAG: amino acid ABC transporter permease [Lachnospiraceae bacterium]|nr:amino acid ABC transporter permease [Lachnospiraceae bacterium]
MDFEVMKTYLPLYREAFFLTLRIGWIGILGAVILGFLAAVIRLLKVPVLHRVIGGYIELFRNTPLLVQLFFLYFGLPKLGLSISAPVCGALGLALLGGAYMAETFRSGFEAVPVLQTETAHALGMSRAQTTIHVLLPEALSVSMPGFTANIIFLLKETSVFSAISLMDLMFTAKDLIGLYFRTVECLTLLVVFYLVLLLPVSILGSLVERRVRYAEFGS